MAKGKRMAVSGSLRHCSKLIIFKFHSENEVFLQSLVYKMASSYNSPCFSSLSDLEVFMEDTH